MNENEFMLNLWFMETDVGSFSENFNLTCFCNLLSRPLLTTIRNLDLRQSGPGFTL